MGEHLNLPGPSKNYMKFTVVEKMGSIDPLYGREQEKVHQRKFNKFYNCLNKESRIRETLNLWADTISGSSSIKNQISILIGGIHVIDRPGVAGAVLQTASSLIN